MNKKNIILIIIVIVLIILSIIFGYEYYEINKKENDKKVAELEQKRKEDKVLNLIGGKINARIYLNSEIKDDNSSVRSKLESLDYIENIEYISKEQALEEMKKQFEENPEIFDGYEGENNIFPVSYTFSIKINSFEDLVNDYLQNIADELRQINNVDKFIIYDYDFKRNYEYYGINESINRLEESIK